MLYFDPGCLPCQLDPGLLMPIHVLRGEACPTGRAVYENRSGDSAALPSDPELSAVYWVGVLHGPGQAGGQVGGYGQNWDEGLETVPTSPLEESADGREAHPCAACG